MEESFKGNSSKSVIVIGGGIGGLFSARELLKRGYKVTVLEKNNGLGGLSTSIPYNGFKLDIGPHFITTPKNSELTNEIEELMKDEIVPISDIHKWYRVFYKNSILNEYPPLYEIIFKNGIKSFLQSIISYSISKIKYSFRKTDFKNARDYINYNYGSYLYKNWFKPYLDFYYGKNEHPIEIVKGKFPSIKFSEIFQKIRKRQSNSNTVINDPLVNYWYFKQGMGALANTLAKNIELMGGKIELCVDIKNIDHEKELKEILIIKNGTEQKLSGDMILYTTSPNVTRMWFKDMIKNEEIPKKPANGILVYLFIDHPKVVDWWLMTNYDTQFSFFRITQQNYLSEFISPPGKSLLCIEINTKENESLWDLDDNSLIEKIKGELESMNFFDIKKIYDYKIFKFRNLYHVTSSDKNSLSEKIFNAVNSVKNEFLVSVEVDAGTLVTKRVEDSGKNEKNVKLGGVFVTLEQSKKIVEQITH